METIIMGYTGFRVQGFKERPGTGFRAVFGSCRLSFTQQVLSRGGLGEGLGVFGLPLQNPLRPKDFNFRLRLGFREPPKPPKG